MAVIKPNVDNRAEALAGLWETLGYDGDEEGSLIDDIAGFQRLVDESNANAYTRANNIALTHHKIALYQRWHNTSEANESLKLAFASFYWAIEFEQTLYIVEELDDDVGCDGFWKMLHWQGVAAASNESWFVEWIAQYLQRLLKKEVAFEHMLTHDEQGRHFLALLQNIIITKQWPNLKDSNELGAFLPLFNTVDDIEHFSQTLVDFYDYRIAQAYGYPSLEATKKRKSGKEFSIYEDDIFLCGVWPIELFTLQYAFKVATGNKLIIEAPHPLLQTNLMKLPFPKLTPLQESATIDKVKSFGKKLYRDNWNPYINKAQQG